MTTESNSYETDFIRELILDYTKPYICKSKFAGYIGEHNATQLTIIPPKEISDNKDVAYYCIKFECGENSISSRIFNIDEKLSLRLWNQLTQNDQLGVQLEAYDKNKEFVAKSKHISNLYFLKSCDKTEVLSDPSHDSLEGQVIEIGKAVNNLKENGAGGHPDMSQNDPSSTDYIRNRTHYYIEETTVEWDGNKDGKESVYIADLIDSSYTLSRRSNSNTSEAIFLVRVKDSLTSPEIFKSLRADDIIFVESGNLVSGSNIIEDFSIVSLNNNSGYAVSPYVIYCTKDETNIEIKEVGSTVTLSAGLWYIYSTGGLYVKSVHFPKFIKQLDPEYIPDISLPKIEIESKEDRAIILIKDKGGNILSSAAIPFGKDGRDGVVSNEEIVSAVESYLNEHYEPTTTVIKTWTKNDINP